MFVTDHGGVGRCNGSGCPPRSTPALGDLGLPRRNNSQPQKFAKKGTPKCPWCVVLQERPSVLHAGKVPPLAPEKTPAAPVQDPDTPANCGSLLGHFQPSAADMAPRAVLYPVRGPAVSVSVCVWATAADEVRRCVEPQPSCSELLPCKTSHAFICVDRSDQVLSIWRVKLRRRGAYLRHDEIARTLPLLSCAVLPMAVRKKQKVHNQSHKNSGVCGSGLTGDWPGQAAPDVGHA